MSSIGTGYDYSATTYSPDGRIYQIEYAEKAVENSGTSVGLSYSTGVVIGIQKLLLSKMLEPGSNRRLQVVDRNVGIVGSGLAPDARQLANRVRAEASNFKRTFGIDIPAKTLADRVASFVHVYTLYSSVRPFGVSTIMAAVDRNGPQLFLVEPSGACAAYRGCAVGKGRQTAKNELEKITKKEGMGMQEALEAVARILIKCQDDTKDKDVEFELGFVDTAGKGFEILSDERTRTIFEAVRARIQAEEDDDDDDDD
nr:20S proteasome subunit alpha type-3 [Andalucia godoyi]|eukprot:ANDGO_03097.mRNA.1 Proteasome subunit alpha type-3